MKFATEGGAITLAMMIVMVIAFGALAILQRIVEGKPYDERQERARGFAAQCGLITMVIFGLGMWIMLDLVQTEMTHKLALIMTVCLGVTVYASVAIWKDAYVDLTSSNGKVLGTLVFIGSYQWVRFAEHLDSFSLAPGDTESWTRLILALIPAWLIILMLLRNFIRRKEEKDSE